MRPVPPGRCLYLYTDSSTVSLKWSAAQSGFALFLSVAAGILATPGSTVAGTDSVDANRVA